jgi:hypothetical protein
MSNAAIKHTVRGEYCVTVLGGDGHEKFTSGYRKNMILDSFFDFTLDTGNQWDNSTPYICVGTGTTPPAATQTALVNQLATRTAANSYSQSVVGGAWQSVNTLSATFALGAVVGNLSEIGLRIPFANANTVQTRALITDSGGLPTTITLTADDQLVVQYRLIISGVDQDYTGTVVINGTAHNWTARRAHANPLAFPALISGIHGQFAVYNGALNSHGVTPSMTSGNASSTDGSTKLTPNSPGQYRIRVTGGINTANVAGGITALSPSQGFYKLGFSPAIPKDSSKVFSFTFEYALVRG